MLHRITKDADLYHDKVVATHLQDRLPSGSERKTRRESMQYGIEITTATLASLALLAGAFEGSRLWLDWKRDHSRRG
jgi:LDH2 family malate/lactate/ureidoglycolate dehydrogenase